MFHGLHTFAGGESRSVSDVCPEATAVNVVCFNIENLQSMIVQELLESAERIVGQMLVANVVESVVGEHRWQIVLLDDPNSRRIEAFGDVRDKRVRIV